MSEPVIEPTVATDMSALLGDATREVEHEVVVADRYRVEELLGTGGMAHVVQATDLVLDRQVAVKLLRETPDAEGDLERFLAETRTLARLSHPGLVTLLDGGTTPAGRPYLVMELVDGPALSASLDEPMEPQRVAEVGAQVAAALAYAHAQGIVHRDVKPANVLLREDGRVKLADFGIAKLLGEQSLHTRTGTVLGSVHYLAPEQVAFEEITPAVDVYGLGLMLLRCLTGHHAFDGPTVESALARLSADPEIPDDLPEGWAALLAEMTARTPADRPSAADVAGRLAWLSGAEQATRVAPPTAVAVPTVRRRLRLSPVPVAAAALAALLFVAAALAGDGAATEKPAAAPSGSPEAQADVVVDQEVSPDEPAYVPAVAEPAPVAKPPKPGKAKHPKAKHPKAKGHKPKPGKGKGKGHHPGKPGKPGKGKPGKGK